MSHQDPYKDLHPSYEEYAFGCAVESNSWIQPSCSLSSVLPERNKSSDEFLILPDLPLQPSISSEEELLSDVNCGKRKAHVEDLETRSEGKLKGQFCSTDQHADQLRRIRYSAVHSISEKRRRTLIKAKIGALQQLMPHCKKKDRASILEDAAAYIKALKLQIEMMTTAQGGECLGSCMPWAGNPCMHFSNRPPFVPIRPGIGVGIGMPFGAGTLGGVAYTDRYPPLIQLPSGCLPCLPSTLAGHLFPAMCATDAEPSSGNCPAETCSELCKVKAASRGSLSQPSGPSATEAGYATATSSYCGLQTGGLSLNKEAGSAK